MSDVNRQAVGLVLLAVIEGALADVLFWRSDPGLKLLVWMATVVVGVAIVARATHLSLTGWGRWAAFPLLAGGAALAWRDSPVLVGLTVVGLLISWGAAIIFGRGGNPWTTSIQRYVVAYVLALGYAVGGAFQMIFSDIKWGALPRGRSTARAVAVGRGLLLAAPLLLLFGLLLMSADAVFHSLVANLFHFELSSWFEHLVQVVFWTLVVGGSVRALFRSQCQVADGFDPLPKVALGVVELSVVLGMLNVLFFAFVLVQFRYFFGGAQVVLASAGLTYADYARRGFFELVAVAALVLPVLLGAHWLLRRAEPAHQRRFRYLAGTMVVLLTVIMGSALQRMRLYQAEYGLTELRLYTTAFMVWLGLLFAWFAVTVLRGKAERFASGAITGGALMLVGLYALNPDAYIARTNVERMSQGRTFDALYLTQLSGDAVPVLLDHLDVMPPEYQRIVAQGLLNRWGDRQSTPDWREWNMSRTLAIRLVGVEAERLRAMQ